MDDNGKPIEKLEELRSGDIVEIASEWYDSKTLGIVQEVGNFDLQIKDSKLHFNDSALCYLLFNPDSKGNRDFADVWVVGRTIGPCYRDDRDLVFRSSNFKITDIYRANPKEYRGWRYYDLESETVKTLS